MHLRNVELISAVCLFLEEYAIMQTYTNDLGLHQIPSGLVSTEDDKNPNVIMQKNLKKLLISLVLR